MSLSLTDVKDASEADIKNAKLRMKQTFTQLPDEILEDIFLEDVLSQKNLCMLALVSQRFGRLTQASLYSQVQLSLLSEKYLSFTRTLSKRPELGSYVWEAQLEGQDWGVESEECFREVQTLLRLLPALRTLKLAYIECSFDLTSVFDIKMPHIRAIFFGNEGRSSSVHEVTKAISAPQIKRLWIEYVWEIEMNGNQLEWTHHGTAFEAPAGTSSVKDLTLNSWHDSHILGSSLLKVPHALERLTCILDYTGNSTPRATIDALRPLYSTLVFLKISYHGSPEELLENFRNGPPADFSCFVCLKNLTVADSLCLERWLSGWPGERSGFYNRLPSTLQTLRIQQVPWSEGTALEQQLNKGHEWLMELAEHKSTAFPGLKEVSLVTHVARPQSFWRYPKQLFNACETAGVYVFVGEIQSWEHVTFP